MKTILLFATMIGITVSCGSEDSMTDEDEYRRIAWEYIDGDLDTTIIGGIHTGRVKSDSFYNLPSVSVTWNTTVDALLGPLTVHINPLTQQVMGINLRD